MIKFHVQSGKQTSRSSHEISNSANSQGIEPLSSLKKSESFDNTDASLEYLLLLLLVLLRW